MKAFVVSPFEPSGVLWIANALLELGVRVEPAGAVTIWEEDGAGTFRLRPDADHYRKVLPAAARPLRFDAGLTASYGHSLPTPAHRAGPVLLFVRDPRDALRSRQRRESPRVGFARYLALRDHRTLLTRVDQWGFFCRAWLAYPLAARLRFEDSKTDPVGTLARAAAALGLAPSRERLERAAAESSFEKAKAADDAYRRANPSETAVHIRSGTAHAWRADAGESEAYGLVARRVADVLRRLGYEGPDGPGEAPDVALHLRSLGALRGVLAPPTADAAAEPEAETYRRVKADALALSEESLADTDWSDGWKAELTASFGEFLARRDPGELARLAGLYARWAPRERFYLGLLRLTGDPRFALAAGLGATGAWLASAAWRAAVRKAGRLAGVRTRYTLEA